MSFAVVAADVTRGRARSSLVRSVRQLPRPNDDQDGRSSAMTEPQRHEGATTFDAEALRPRLFGIAYRMLGSVADAEDAVQETFLRWQQTRRGGDPITAPEGWLVSVITR